MTDNNLLFVRDPAKSTYETIGAVYITAHPAKGNVQPQHISHPAQWREEEASQAVAGRLRLIKNSVCKLLVCERRCVTSTA